MDLVFISFFHLFVLIVPFYSTSYSITESHIVLFCLLFSPLDVMLIYAKRGSSTGLRFR